MVKRIVTFVALLFVSNSFMNMAWYGHLKYKTSPLWLAIAASWGIAFFEYCFQVPANRIGSADLSLTQLKVIQEIITLVTFAIFSFVAFREKPTVNHMIAFGLIVAAAYFVVKK
ncbi:MAG: DMT family protein [Fimbriimonadaceae bacterium]